MDKLNGLQCFDTEYMDDWADHGLENNTVVLLYLCTMKFLPNSRITRCVFDL